MELYQEFFNEIKKLLRFLTSCVIKFTPFEQLINRQHALSLGMSIDQYNDSFEPKDRAYYLILQGKDPQGWEIEQPPTFYYADGTQYSLTLEELNNQPYLRSYLKSNFDKLIKPMLDNYPELGFRIITKIWPIKDIDKAVEAPDLTLLNYEKTYLNSQEQEDLPQYLQQWLYYIYQRWYIPTFEYEELYPHAFYSMVIFTSFLILLYRQIQNIRTDKVNYYYLWNHLGSFGLYPFKGYLPFKVEQFLYRNIWYFKRNKGTNFVFKLVNDFLRNYIGVEAKFKAIYHSPYKREDKAIWSSFLVSEDFETKTINPGTDMTFDQLYQELKENNLIQEDDPIPDSSKFDYTTYLKSNTKFAYLFSSKRSVGYDVFLFGWIWNSFLYAVSNNALKEQSWDLYQLLGKSSSDKCLIGTLDVYIIFNYLLTKFFKFGDETSPIPTKVVYVYPTTENLKNIKVYTPANNPLPINYIISNYNTLIQEIQEHSNIQTIQTKEAFTDFVFYFFDFIIDKVIQIRAHETYIQSQSLVQFLKAIFKKQEKFIDIPFTTYENYFASNPKIKQILDSIEPDYYIFSIKNILTNICYISSEKSKFLTSNIYIEPPLPILIKLLKQIVSYDVVWLYEFGAIIPMFFTPKYDGHIACKSIYKINLTNALKLTSHNKILSLTSTLKKTSSSRFISFTSQYTFFTMTHTTNKKFRIVTKTNITIQPKSSPRLIICKLGCNKAEIKEVK